MTLIWVTISLNLFICKMGIRPHKTAGELNKIMMATMAGKVKSIAASFLTPCKEIELVPYIGTKLKFS